MTTNNKISNLISSQVPFFVRNDHAKFMRFMEAYYEFLEQQNQEIDRIKNLTNYFDADKTTDIFAEKFYEQYLKLLPENVEVDRTLVLKHIKDFYRARGTQNSVEFLLRLLFNKDSSYYYPKRDVLKTSDGKWFQERSIKVRDVKINNNLTNDIDDVLKFATKNIKGNTSNARAVVESVDVYYDRGSVVYELKISSLVRDFESAEVIFTTIEEDGQTKSLTANLFSGIVSSVVLTASGNGYTQGTSVPVVGGNGTGAVVQVGDVTRGNIQGIGVTFGGAGFSNSNFVLFSGGGGTGANANVSVIADGFYHPSSYNIVSSIISLESNTTIGNAVYTNLSSTNANTTIANSVNTFTLSGLGPIIRSTVLNPGDNYVSIPTLDVEANTMLRSLGILGRMNVVNGGTSYTIGDTITFTNVLGGYGTGAAGNVRNVDANGKITEVGFVQVPGHFIGGAGYDQSFLPTANVISGTGSGANVQVVSILGDGDNLSTTVDSIGSILNLVLISGGSGYTSAPTINLAALGDGTAQANSFIITGTFTFPGRYLNDDGHLSSFNFLEDRDYYQNFSYVVRIEESLNKYRKAINDLIQPAGMKLFGEYLKEDNELPTVIDDFDTEDTVRLKFKNADYYSTANANGSNIAINLNTHGFAANDNAYIEFLSTSSRNVAFVNIANAGLDYSNGYINFTSNVGSNANAYVSVNATGSITSIRIDNRGTGYKDAETVTANVSNLITYNIASIAIANAGSGYSNGFVAISGGSGRRANANISVNANGAIVSVTINNRGTGYLNGETLNISLPGLLSYNIANVNIASGGTGYTNGFVIFKEGSGYAANANVSVDANGTIVGIYVLRNGNGYKLTDLNIPVDANVSHLRSYNVGNVQLIAAGRDLSNGYITFVGGSGTGANANIGVNALGSITTITLNATGSGFANGEVIEANVYSLLTHNIASISISNAGVGYSNGFITFTGGTGRLANANISVNATGAITNVNIFERGTAYTAGDTVTANVYNLLKYNVASINIVDGGTHYLNTENAIVLSGGTGSNATANIRVNATGGIVSYTIENRGFGYSSNDVLSIRTADFLSTNIASITIRDPGKDYMNGYIYGSNIFNANGTARGANVEISVNANGSIMFANVINGGTGFRFGLDLILTTINLTPLIVDANTYVPADLKINLNAYDDKANLEVVLQTEAGGANLPVTLQLGSANSHNIKVSLSPSGNGANLLVNLQEGVGGANLTTSLQKGVGAANLVVNLQPEPVEIPNGIYRVVTTNTNWFFVQYANSSNTFGTASAGILL